MIKSFCFSFLTILLSFFGQSMYSQNKLPFGDITLEELSNKPYKPEPGAAAVILSKTGVVTVNYSNGFYVELEVDVRIKIINSNGFDYANIEIPYSLDDNILSYRASTFNTRNGEKVETKIPSKSFIKERTTNFYNTLKFNFPDVHEGTVIEYSYLQRLNDYAINSLVSWAFQSEIPTAVSSITVVYPEYFKYKTIVSGSANDVHFRSNKAETFFLEERVNVQTENWYSVDVPSFRNEPYIKSIRDNLIRIVFELESYNVPGSYFKEISPTYATLTKKLLESTDFGQPIKNNFKSLAEKITAGQKDDLSKLKKIHEYISTKILWNGVQDFTTSSSLRTILNKEKGTSGDINLLLIAMLRSLNIKADPVILSTRSNGSLNQLSAMIGQFNYVVAYVSVNGNYYLVDATDPIRPFNILPFDCLNGAGRLINEYESKFIDLKNNEKNYYSYNYTLTLDTSGAVSGKMENRYSNYSAYALRELIKRESEDGYLDIVKSAYGNMDVSDFKITNFSYRDSDLFENCTLKIANWAQVAGDEIIFNPYLKQAWEKNPFYAPERKFQIDFGCPVTESYSLTLIIPKGYSILQKPENVTITIGKNDGKFEYKCTQNGNKLEIKSLVNIDKTIFQPSEYSVIQGFYSQFLQKKGELIVLKRNSIIN
jgi:transglutaminase-like putative cysteine protease